MVLPLVIAAMCLPVSAETGHAKKLYWFVPDGMRADPYLFNIYEWAEQGELPNIKKMMENGTYGFSKPVYPGHTPVNFASLFTGSYPEVHGVADGPMHAEGRPLQKPALSGFSSSAKKVDPVWVTLEQNGKSVALLSIPGSTPPELKKGYTVAGRWGGWGANFTAVNFQDAADGTMRHSMGRATRLFYQGPPLTVFANSTAAARPASGQNSYSPDKTAIFEAWGATVAVRIYDDTDDGEVNYGRIAFSGSDGKVLADLAQGDVSGWLPVVLKWGGLNIKSSFRIMPILLRPDGFFRVRFLYNTLNDTVAQPAYIVEDLLENAGPMVDFVDNFPAQLVFYEEDKAAFLREAGMSFDWHRNAASHIIDKYSPDALIHDIYSPNQMLTSRWWLGYVDPDSDRYETVSESERALLWREVKAMYRQLDGIIGLYLARADKDTLVVLSSDHGAAPLNKLVHLNNLFAAKGWLHFSVDAVSGEPVMDWRSSKVVYLKDGHVYVSPEGLQKEDGNWYRASGKAYETLRAEVVRELETLKDADGTKPLMKIAGWESAESRFRLPHERAGDLIISNRPGYGWSEEVSANGNLFSVPRITGYKQSIVSDDYPAMWCPFMIAGPGVKKNNYLGDKPFSLVDQYPTILKLMAIPLPDFVQGKRVDAVFMGKSPE